MRSEFNPATLRTEGDLLVSGTVTFDDAPRPPGFIRVAWAVRQGWRMGGGIAVVEEDGAWQQIETTPGGWAAAAPDDFFSFTIEAFGVLVAEPEGRRATEGGPSVTHEDAFVWSQVVPVYLEAP